MSPKTRIMRPVWKGRSIRSLMRVDDRKRPGGGVGMEFAATARNVLAFGLEPQGPCSCDRHHGACGRRPRRSYALMAIRGDRAHLPPTPTSRRRRPVDPRRVRNDSERCGACTPPTLGDPRPALRRQRDGGRRKSPAASSGQGISPSVAAGPGSPRPNKLTAIPIAGRTSLRR
jgi:hypothetical protein